MSTSERPEVGLREAVEELADDRDAVGDDFQRQYDRMTLTDVKKRKERAFLRTMAFASAQEAVRLRALLDEHPAAEAAPESDASLLRAYYEGIGTPAHHVDMLAAEAAPTAGERDRTFLLPDDCDCLPPYSDCTHGPSKCGSCGESPENECPDSKRPCGHHCNHVWTHDACDWCGQEFGTSPATPDASGGLSEEERRDMHMALSDSYDDLDEFVHSLVAARVADAEARARREHGEKIAQAIEALPTYTVHESPAHGGYSRQGVSPEFVRRDAASVARSLSPEAAEGEGWGEG